MAVTNIINLILVLSICLESSLVLLEEGVCYNQYILLAKLLAFALLHFVLQGKLACHSRFLLTSYFAFQSPRDDKGIFFLLLLVLEDLVGIHRSIQLKLLWH